MRLVVSTDGFCAPNPGGLATWSFIVHDESNAVVASANGVAAVPPFGGSAVAEWCGAYQALAWLAAFAPDGAAITVRSDNQGMHAALSGASRVPREDPERFLAQESRTFTSDLASRGCVVEFLRVPRWENQEADALAYEAWKARKGGRRPLAPPWMAPRAGDSPDSEPFPPSRRGNR